MAIARGYVPVTKLEFNIMASRNALSKMDFPKPEIDKIEYGLKTRNKVLKSAKLIKRNLQDVLEGKREHLTLPEPVTCDICRESTGIGVAKLTSPEQEAKIPSGWLLLKSDWQGEHRAYAVIPPSVVIDYDGRRAYLVCGTCQGLLGLQPTELGLLIHEVRGRQGYVDLDRIKQLIEGNA